MGGGGTPDLHCWQEELKILILYINKINININKINITS